MSSLKGERGNEQTCRSNKTPCDDDDDDDDRHSIMCGRGERIAQVGQKPTRVTQTKDPLDAKQKRRNLTTSERKKEGLRDATMEMNQRERIKTAAAAAAAGECVWKKEKEDTSEGIFCLTNCSRFQLSKTGWYSVHVHCQTSASGLQLPKINFIPTGFTIAAAAVCCPRLLPCEISVLGRGRSFSLSVFLSRRVVAFGQM